MRKPASLALTLMTLTFGSGAAYAVDVRICTTRGAIDVELDDRRAPLHAANFVRYAESGFYDGTILHRAVPGSMVQGGSYTLGLERRTPGEPVRNESGLPNQRGTIAASRSDDPDSATSQFFFNLADNTHLDARPGAPGFTVFGRVTAGLEVLDAIAAMPTGRRGALDELPQPLVEVEAVTVLDRQSQFGLSIEPDPQTLRADLETMRRRGDAAGILGAIDALRRSCIDLGPSERQAEAEAASALGLADRSRYALERYLATANVADPGRSRAEQLLGGLPEAEPARDVESLITHCRRPVPPSIPDGRFTELAAMRAVEGAVLRFRQLSELYLACVARVIENQELGETETVELTKRHNDVVVETTAALLRFNEAARAFKEAQ